MGKTAAALGSIVFFFVAPFMVAGWVPWSLTRWRRGAPFLDLAVLPWLGVALFAFGVVLVLECFARFALQGLGTPAPVAPTRDLVITGAYRFVRNPMYVGVLAAILGQALFFGSTRLLVYAGGMWLAFVAFVLLYEEPSLRDRFGASYEAYRAHVPRWVPRITPWEPGG